MGLYLSTYCGPIVVAKVTSKSKSDMVRKCPKCNCKRDGAKFCLQCGSKIEFVVGPVVFIQYPHSSDVFLAFKAANLSDKIEALHHDQHLVYDKGYDIYTPNEDRNHPRGFTQIEAEYCTIDIDDINVQSEKDWLATAFAPEIAILKSVYESVEIKWVFANNKS